MSMMTRQQEEALEASEELNELHTALDVEESRRRKKRKPIDWIGPIAVFGLFIGGWYLMSTTLLSPQKRFLLPRPDQVLTKAVFKWDKFQPILEALWLSTRSAMIGLAIAIVIGIGLATLMSQASWVERSLWPFLVGIQSSPILALTPLIGALLGFNLRSRVFVVILIAVFPIVQNTLFGLLSADKGMHEMFTLHKVSRITRLTKLQFPAAAPLMFTGLRNAAGLSVIGAVVGDVYFRQGQAGIGSLIDIYRAKLRGAEMVACIIVAALLGLFVFLLFGFIMRKAVGRWHEATRGS